VPAYGPQNDVTLKMPAFEWVHVQLHQQKGMISLSPPTICNSAVTDASGRPISFFITAGQVSDYTGAAALLDELPKAKWLLADRGYDADWYRDALQAKGITPCIPGRKSRKKTIKYDKRRYKRRNRIEIMFGRLKDWRRVATRYDRCPMAFLSAIALAATVIFWL
ncbi:IS5 family transposase, partial [Citrobacter youngae]